MIVSTFDINVEIPPTVRIGDQCHRSHNVILSQSRKVHDTVTYSSIKLSRGDSLLLHIEPQKHLKCMANGENRDWHCSAIAKLPWLWPCLQWWNSDKKRHLSLDLYPDLSPSWSHDKRRDQNAAAKDPSSSAHWRRGTCVLVPFYDLTMTNATNGRAFHPVQLQFDCGLLDGSTCTQHESVS